MVVAAGELIPGDGEVVEGAASVDESAITGESALRHQGGRRGPQRGHRRNRRACSDSLVIRITANPGEGDSLTT